MSERSYAQLCRIIRLAEWFQENGPATLREVYSSFESITGSRTVRRDVSLLIRINWLVRNGETYDRKRKPGADWEAGAMITVYRKDEEFPATIKVNGREWKLDITDGLDELEFIGIYIEPGGESC